MLKFTTDQCAINRPVPVQDQSSPSGTHPCQASFLQHFAAHKVAPAILHYTAGALVFSGAALFFCGFGALPGIILMSVGMALFMSATTILTCHLPENIGTGDYLTFSTECFVWGACFVFTLPTIILLKITLHYVTKWLLQDQDAFGGGGGQIFSSDLTWLMAPPTKDLSPDSLGFSGLEVA